jgi:hypothetical protein
MKAAIVRTPAFLLVLSMVVLACAGSTTREHEAVEDGEPGERPPAVIACILPRFPDSRTSELWLAGERGSEVIALAQSSPGRAPHVGTELQIEPLGAWPLARYRAQLGEAAYGLAITRELASEDGQVGWTGELGEGIHAQFLACGYFEGDYHPDELRRIATRAMRPIELPAELPRTLSTPTFAVDGFAMSLINSTEIGGMAGPDGSVDVSHSFTGWLSFTLRVGDEPVTFESVEVYVRPVSVEIANEITTFAECSGEGNVIYDEWTPLLTATRLLTDPPRANGRYWELEAAAGSELNISYSANGEQFPGGYFTYVVKFTEHGGTVHWVETSALAVVYIECVAP